jgi:hypothetical protein
MAPLKRSRLSNLQNHKLKGTRWNLKRNRKRNHQRHLKVIIEIWIDLQNYWLNGNYEKKGEIVRISNSTNIIKTNTHLALTSLSPQTIEHKKAQYARHLINPGHGLGHAQKKFSFVPIAQDKTVQKYYQNINLHNTYVRLRSTSSLSLTSNPQIHVRFLRHRHLYPRSMSFFQILKS